MKRFGSTSVALLTVLSLAASPAPAQVVAGGTVGGLGTFIDTNTGLQWLRLDNFFNMTPGDMVAQANGAGFTLANFTEVQTLWASLPLDAGQWASYQPILGDAPNRELFWGGYSLGNTVEVGWGYAFDTDATWQAINSSGWDELVNTPENPQFVDLNLWAYRQADTEVVPEPATMTLLATGLAGMAAARRKKRNT